MKKRGDFSSEGSGNCQSFVSGSFEPLLKPSEGKYVGKRGEGGFIVGGRNVAESLRGRTDRQQALSKEGSFFALPSFAFPSPSRTERTDCFLATDGAQIRGHNSSMKERGGDISLRGHT